MALANINVIYNTVQNYLRFWMLVYGAVSWYIPTVQYQSQFVIMYICIPSAAGICGAHYEYNNDDDDDGDDNIGNGEYSDDDRDGIFRMIMVIFIRIMMIFVTYNLYMIWEYVGMN